MSRQDVCGFNTQTTEKPAMNRIACVLALALVGCGQQEPAARTTTRTEAPTKTEAPAPIPAPKPASPSAAIPAEAKATEAPKPAPADPYTMTADEMYSPWTIVSEKKRAAAFDGIKAKINGKLVKVEGTTNITKFPTVIIVLPGKQSGYSVAAEVTTKQLEELQDAYDEARQNKKDFRVIACGIARVNPMEQPKPKTNGRQIPGGVYDPHSPWWVEIEKPVFSISK